MTCREWQERIAADDPEASRHLESCAGCREFAAGLQESLELLRRAHLESPGDAALAAVRARVLARIARRRWLPVWAGAAAAAAVLLFGWIREAPRPVPLPPAPPPAVERVSEEPTAPAKPKPAVHLRRMRKPPPEPVVVKLITDDPNVVIYWIADPKGD